VFFFRATYPATHDAHSQARAILDRIITIAEPNLGSSPNPQTESHVDLKKKGGLKAGYDD
jgi:hypothetical protein